MKWGCCWPQFLVSILSLSHQLVLFEFACFRRTDYVNAFMTHGVKVFSFEALARCPSESWSSSMITCALVTEADGSSTPAPTQTNIGRSVVRLMNDNHEINISKRCSYMFVMILLLHLLLCRFHWCNWVWHSGQSEICIHLLNLWALSSGWWWWWWWWWLFSIYKSSFLEDPSLLWCPMFLCTVRQHENPLTLVECVLDKPWC